MFPGYAQADRAAVQRIRDALALLGLEAWYEQSGLLGGDACNQRIRRQIGDRDFFMPVVSARTDAPRAGYLRRAWGLAIEHTLDMADDTMFLVPVAIDGTAGAHAPIPAAIRTMPWVRVPGGQPNAVLGALCRGLIAGKERALPFSTPRRGRGENQCGPPNTEIRVIAGTASGAGFPPALPAMGSRVALPGAFRPAVPILHRMIFLMGLAYLAYDKSVANRLLQSVHLLVLLCGFGLHRFSTTGSGSAST